jgi:hypothetical protein
MLEAALIFIVCLVLQVLGDLPQFIRRHRKTKRSQFYLFNAIPDIWYVHTRPCYACLYVLNKCYVCEYHHYCFYHMYSCMHVLIYIHIYPHVSTQPKHSVSSVSIAVEYANMISPLKNLIAFLSPFLTPFLKVAVWNTHTLFHVHILRAISAICLFWICVLTNTNHNYSYQSPTPTLSLSNASNHMGNRWKCVVVSSPCHSCLYYAVALRVHRQQRCTTR